MKKIIKTIQSFQLFNNFVIFKTENGKVNIDVFLRTIHFGLLKKMSELF